MYLASVKQCVAKPVSLHYPNMAQKKQYTAEFKFKAVVESYQRDTTIEEVCRKFGLASSVIHRWRKEFQEHGPGIFADKRDP